MAIIPWHKNVQRKQQLTFDTKGMGAKWSKVLDKAIAEFNKQMSKIGVKLVLTKAGKGKRPHVILETRAGNDLHGTASLQTMILNRVQYLDRVTIRMPATPRIDPRDSRSREVGPGVRIALLVHEMIHAVGLGNAEHASNDVFAARSIVIPEGQYLKDGKQAKEDLVQPPDGSTPIPPIRIGAKTIANLKKAWTAR